MEYFLFLIVGITIIILTYKYAQDPGTLVCVAVLTSIFGIAILFSDSKNDRALKPIMVVLSIISICSAKAKHLEMKWEEERPERERKQKEREEERKRERREQERKENEYRKIEELKRQIEQTAMSKAMSHERNHDRTPTDVSSENLGYDIKSSGYNETRFIEVKGKSNYGDIEITPNEWKKAKEMENNYFLYVVYECSDSFPSLKIVRNPAKKLSTNYDTHYNRYKVTKNEIYNNAE